MHSSLKQRISFFVDMNKNNAFQANTRFYGDEHYPYGLARSGEFNHQQVKLLEQHGNAYKAIHAGQREPSGKEEQEFLEMCLGKKEPETAHEKAWACFCRKSEKGPVISPFGRSCPPPEE